MQIPPSARSGEAAPDPAAPVAESAADIAVSVRGLVKRFGATTAVAGLDLTLRRGSVLALLGPNGAGKTTTIEVCTGFLRADSGEVRVLGFDPAGAPDALRARIGIMPQGGGAYPGVKAGEMLRVVAACAANPLDPAWLIDVLGLSGATRTPYKRLSGGQQQRLALACAVVGRPELVVLDEPTAGMDPQARRVVWELVSALRRDGVAVLLTTHLMEEAEALADEVVIVDHGRVVAAGSPAELTSGGDEQELRFRARTGMDVEALTAALPAGYRAAETVAGRYVVRGRIDPHVLSAITGWCAGQGALADDVQVARRSLEDVFLDLTGRELRS
ncbi:ABC transporter ATP-binding protein [Pseudonocardia halophobica]|uniref:Spermidine/putrescine ABC transporter ATP-binding protein n=1 Tax=Pseudonocardia halophobica TaxID=29401 RepID=A0A9W6L2L8_9PSEU|nr:spermidine/putrescine ABC transporter ATP-binding protein [Pseudonocardia halophobica]